MQANAINSPYYLRDAYSHKDFVVTILLCFFLGNFGVHRFYAGKIGTGVLMLFTFGGFGIWTIYDMVMIATGNFTDRDGHYVTPGS